ncbi:MAG TPA: phosphate acyltransferase [Gemmatimonadales bacterium]|nr:phosphate acyltransferase [Gemmatimonadales bacterium]
MSLAALLQRAARRPARLLLAGGDIAMLQQAAARLTDAGMGSVQVVGAGAMQPEGHARLNSVALLLRSRESNRVRDGIHALDLAVDPVRFAAGLLALGDVDAVVAGPGVFYEDLADSVHWTLGAPMDGGPVHSATWLLLEDGSLIGLADCVEPQQRPPAAQARLARAVARTHAHVAEGAARVTFLSGPPSRTPSLAASEAVSCLRTIDPAITAEADPPPRFRGRADVLIFPDGTVGHLAARTVRALTGALILGPLLLGPPGTVAGVTDDSNLDELVGTAAVAVLAAGTAAT